MQIVSIGEVLWDQFGTEEFLGGAPLNFSANSIRLGDSVAILTAVGSDDRGTRAIAEMERLGLDTRLVQTSLESPTGLALVSTDSTGNGTFVIQRPAAFDCLHCDEVLLSGIQGLQPDWVYYGTLAQTNPQIEAILLQLANNSEKARRFYDMNLRAGHWSLPLVQRLSQMADVIKLNDIEAALLFRLTDGKQEFTIREFCQYWSSIHHVEMICVTLGSQGCAVFSNGRFETFRGYKVSVVDTVGAGDAFAAAFLHGLHRGWPIERIAPFANGLGALVASRAGATPAWTIEECAQVMNQVSNSAVNH